MCFGTLKQPDYTPLSLCIKLLLPVLCVHPQVVFKLHPSFAQPVRPVEGPAYELTETGWGEFDIGVEVSC